MYDIYGTVAEFLSFKQNSQQVDKNSKGEYLWLLRN